MTRNKRLLPYVKVAHRKSGTRYRACVSLDGRRVYGRWLESMDAAYAEATSLMRDAKTLPERLPTLDDGIELVRQNVRLNRTAGTAAWYEQQFTQLGKLVPLDTPLVGIRRAEVEALVAKRIEAASAATARHMLRALSRIYTLSMREGWATENPTTQIDPPRVDDPEVHWFTRAELQDLMAKLTDPVERDLLVLFAYTGLRAAEVCRVRRQDVSLRRGELWVRGKRGSRVVPIDADLEPSVGRLLERGGDHLTDAAEVRRVFRRLRRRFDDRRMHPHSLRHTFATLLIQGGERPDVVQHLLGHRTIAMVMRYSHQHGPDSRRAVEPNQVVGHQTTTAAWCVHRQ